MVNLLSFSTSETQDLSGASFVSQGAKKKLPTCLVSSAALNMPTILSPRTPMDVLEREQM